MHNVSEPNIGVIYLKYSKKCIVKNIMNHVFVEKGQPMQFS